MIVVIIVLAIAGIVVFAIGLSGSIVTATAVSNSQIKKIGLLFFISLILAGLSCIAVIVGFFTEVTFFFAPMFILVGAAVAVLGTVGIVAASKFEKTAPKIISIILLAVSTCIGALMLGGGVLSLLMF